MQLFYQFFANRMTKLKLILRKELNLDFLNVILLSSNKKIEVQPYHYEVADRVNFRHPDMVEKK